MPTSAVPPVTYNVTVKPDSHELSVEIQLTGEFANGDHLLLQTPTWVPGNYSFQKFARDVFSVSAKDASSGESLTVSRDGWQGFRVDKPTGDVIVSYRVFGFEPEFGEPCGVVDSQYAVLLGTRYLYCPDYLGECRVTYTFPEDWAFHHPSGAEESDGGWNYPSYEILLDTPVSMGEIDVKQRLCGDTPIYFVFVDKGVGYDARVEEFVDKIAEVAEFFRTMFGGFPFEDYTFVLSLNPQNEWGLEHLSSTMCGLGADVFTDDDKFNIGIRVCAHEMFHAWNVRRLRPAPLLQLQHALSSGSFTEGLWVAEGFTRYYEFVSCTSTGVYSPQQFLSNIVGYLQHLTVLPAYERVSVADSSLATYLNHHPSYPGQVDNSIDYYNKGMLIAFGVDVALRLSGDSLDAAFRDFYNDFVDWPLEAGDDNPGYSTETVLDFFDNRLAGLGEHLRPQVIEPANLDTLERLGDLGFVIQEEDINYLGLFFSGVLGATIHDVLDTSPAGESGLAPGDVITRVNGFQFSTAGLQWAATHHLPVVLDVTRGHRALQFELQPGQRTIITGLVWQGDESQASLLYSWLGTAASNDSFILEPGTRIPVDFYENFHGLETVL